MACHVNRIMPSCKRLSLARQFSTLRFLPGSAESVSGSESSNASGLHSTAVRGLPVAAALPLPSNVREIPASEVGCFSPQRSRDICGSFIAAKSDGEMKYSTEIDITVESDPRMNSYDCRGAVNLSSSMQSNVPSPFVGGHCFLGMPGSQWGHGQKFISDRLQNSHYLNLRNAYGRGIHSAVFTSGTIRPYSPRVVAIPANSATDTDLSHSPTLHMVLGNRCTDRGMSSDAPQPPAAENAEPVSRKERLKRAVAAYGSTVIVFHVTISLASLGTSYLLVSSGLDVMALMDYFGLADTAFSQKIAANAGTFVVAYALHKVFAPVRIGITLTATPFIVRYLRRVGILKTPVN